MDLFKFIQRQRFLNFATLGLLSGNQVNFVNKMSYPVLRESTDTATASEDDNKLMWAKAPLSYVDKLQASADPVSKRLINLFRVKKIIQYDKNADPKEASLAKRMDDVPGASVQVVTRSANLPTNVVGVENGSVDHVSASLMVNSINQLNRTAIKVEQEHAEEHAFDSRASRGSHGDRFSQLESDIKAIDNSTGPLRP